MLGSICCAFFGVSLFVVMLNCLLLLAIETLEVLN